MSKTPKERNEELLQEVATKSGLPKEKVMDSVPMLVKFYSSFNPKSLGGYLKAVLQNIPEGQGIPQDQGFLKATLAQQITKDWESKGEKYAQIIDKVPGAIEAASKVLGVNLSDPAASGYDKQTKSLDSNVLAETILKCQNLPATEDVESLRQQIITEAGVDAVRLSGQDQESSSEIDDSSAAAGRG